MARLEIDISGDNRKLVAALNDSKSKLTEFQNAVGRLNASAFDPLTRALNDLKASFRDLQRLAQGLNLNQNGGGNGASSLAQARLDAANYRTEIARLNRDLAALRLANAQNRQGNNAAAGSYREAQQRLTALGNAIRNAAGGFNSTNPAIQAQIRQYRELNEQLRRFDRTMGNNYRNVGNYGSAFASAIPVIGQLTTVVGALALAQQGLAKSFSTNLKFDALEYSIRQVSTSAANFTDNMNFLRETSDRLGLDLMTTSQSFKLWQGAAKFSNLTALESRDIFESVANASAKMKLSADDTQGAIRALSQMMSKGKIQAEELRGQLGERIPGAFALAAQAMGVTEAELNKMMETGKLVANDFLPKFAAQFDKSFGNDKTQKI